MRRLIALLLSASIAACGDRPAPAPASPAVKPAPTAPQPLDATEPTPSASPTTPSAKLALDGEGLRVFQVDTGSASLIAFDTPQAEVLRRVTAVLGQAPEAQGENADCGARYGTWPHGLTTWFMHDRFVGWSVRPAADPLTTASSLRIGSTRSDLDAAYTAKVFRSTLGTEFLAGGIAGLLESASPDAKVIHLWAGNSCVAR